MNFEPVATLAELDTLDREDMAEGYLSADIGDPEPGPNRGKAYWHGWRCRMMDHALIPIDDVHRKLVHEVVTRERAERARVKCSA